MNFSKFEFSWKKNQIFMLPCYSTCEDLTIDVSMNNVGLILMKLGWFQLFGTSQNSISNFKKKNLIFVFPCCSSWRPFQWCINYQCNYQGDFFLGVRTKFNFVNFELFGKKINFLGFNAVVLVKTFPLM